MSSTFPYYSFDYIRRGLICILHDQSSEIMQGYDEALKAASNEKSQQSLSSNIEAVADMKFTYVVTCQNYGVQKRTQDPRANDIFNLMKE